MIDKNLSADQLNNGVATLEKVYYRRGMAYLHSGDLAKAKEDLLKAHEYTGMNSAVMAGLKLLKDKQDKNRVREKETAERMFNSSSNGN